MVAPSATELFDACRQLIGADEQLEATLAATQFELPNGCPIKGPGFFPVASGSFHDDSVDTPLGSRKIMFVGQDWGSRTNLCQMKRDPDSDLKFGTGRVLRMLLAEVGIPEDQCFFTNALFGVRRTSINTGVSPGWKHSPFVAGCASALQFQIDVIQPSVVICMGRHAPRLLEIVFPECKFWSSASSFMEIDEAKKAVMTLNSVSGPSMAAILLHPSYRTVNARYRCYGGKSGLEAEALILKDAWVHANQSRIVQ